MIEKETYLYEVLIRGARDGSIAGAHQIYNEVLIDKVTGELLNERQGVASELASNDVGELLGSAFVANAAQVLELRRQIEHLTIQREELHSRLDAAAPGQASISPSVISDRQFAQGLAARELITRGEALAFVQTGALPVLLANFLASVVDESKRFEINMLLSGAKEFRRDHPLASAIAEWAGMDAAAFDAFWSQCSML